MCRCQVESGQGHPTNRNGILLLKQQHDNWRLALACQVKVKENIEMHSGRSSRNQEMGVRSGFQQK